MPLRDHFTPPLSVQRPWEGFHGSWANAIANDLNGTILPAEYVALPLVSHGTSVEIDVATYQESTLSPSGGTTQWSPAAPAWSAPVKWQERDLFEIRVIRQTGGPRLVAAVELVSPANKDRPAARQAFAGKCAGYLRQGVGLVVVDVVTGRGGNLHQELVELLELNGAVPPRLATDLYAVAYRASTDPGASRLDVWPHALKIAERMPTLPLWLTPELSVPLDLEASYAATCRSLRIT